MQPYKPADMILPGWWVQAYECMVCSSTPPESGHSLITQSHIAPALSPLELDALAVIISHLQKSILSGQHVGITFGTEHHFKHAGHLPRSQRVDFERVLHNIGSLHVIARSDQTRIFRPLVKNVQWKIIRSKQPQSQITSSTSHNTEDFELSIDIAPNATELILGLMDAHTELLRWYQGDVCTFPINHDKSPLAIWRSLWLDLPLPETILYLRLEKAMQWHCQWLGLMGVFGVDFNELCQNLPYGKHHTLALLNRFARRLESHGLLANLDTDLLAIEDSDHSSAPRPHQIIWQASRKRLLEDHLSPFKQACRDILLRPLHSTLRTQWLRMLIPEGNSTETYHNGEKLWSTLAVLNSKEIDSEPEKSYCEFGESLLWSPKSLFFELSMRSTATTNLFPQIPEIISTSPLGSLTSLAGAKAHSIERRFAEFCLILQDMPDLCQVFSQVAFASLASPVTRKLLTKQDASVQRSAVATTQTPDVNIMSMTLAQIPTNVPKPPVLPVETARVEAAQVLSSRMMRTAELELSTIRRQDQERYNELRRAYLESLDELGQKLILDVQRRMQTNMFEEHLRKRIVRFMVENPGVWTSSGEQQATKHISKTRHHP